MRHTGALKGQLFRHFGGRPILRTLELQALRDRALLAMAGWNARPTGGKESVVKGGVWSRVSAPGPECICVCIDDVYIYIHMHVFIHVYIHYVLICSGF